MGKFKPHKGMLKRCRITKSGKVKVRIANGSHLRSGKPADRLRHFRQGRYITTPGYVRKMTNLLGRPIRRADVAIEKVEQGQEK